MLCAEVRPSREQGLKTLLFGTREGYLRRAVPGALRQFRPCPLYLSSTHLLVPVACARRATPPGLTDRRQNVFVTLAYAGRIPVDYFQCLSSSDAFSLPFGGFIGTLNFCLIPVYVLFFLFFFFSNGMVHGPLQLHSTPGALFIVPLEGINSISRADGRGLE